MPGFQTFRSFSFFTGATIYRLRSSFDFPFNKLLLLQGILLIKRYKMHIGVIVSGRLLYPLFEIGIALICRIQNNRYRINLRLFFPL